MSAWPQAIWVVKKIQKSFNYIYDNIKSDIENLQAKDIDLENQINAITSGEGGFNVAVADFVDTEAIDTETGQHIPANLHDTTTGTIWFVKNDT